MRAAIKELPVSFETAGATIREVEWGDMHIGIESHAEALDLTPFFRGAPHDMCVSPHWGYVISGRFRVRYLDGREEECKAGDIYYMPPHHTVTLEPGTLLVEFSPKDEYAATMEIVLRNLEQLA
jgi:quercetin dioxygenase-like cupin family protein